ncbi:MAG: hypothetical protein ABIH46_11770, partial [Chloroflexota bacterium]
MKDLNQDAYFALLSASNLKRILDNMKYSLEGITRNKSLREAMGSILLRSSDDSMRGLLARGILQHSRLHTLSHAPVLVRWPVLGLIGSKVTSDNVLYALLAEKEFVVSEVEKARRALDNEWFSLPLETFIEHFRTLLCGKAIIDAAYFPAQLDFGFGLHGTEYNPSVSDIVQATQDERHNFLIPYYRDEVLPLFRRERPDIVGISITHTSDFIPAFVLAHMLKKEDENVHVTLGGSTLTEVAYRLAKLPALWEFFDSLVLGPGERAFSSLIEELEKGRDLSGVPNVVYKDGSHIKESDKL